MPKLFAMEESEKESSNELLIDKLLERNKQPDSPVSLTANLLKQREEIGKEVSEQLESDEDESSEVADDEDEDTDSGEEKDKEEESSEDESDDSKKEEKAADDKDELTSLIGSGLSDKEDDKKEETATESFSHKANLNTLFDSVRHQYDRYLISLENYNLKEQAVPVTKQPVVYVKEAILDSIKNLTTVSFKYIDNNSSFIKTIGPSILSLNERITALSLLVENEKYHFTHKLVNDKDIITKVSYKDHNDPRETSRLLLRYLDDSNAAISLVVNNSFEDMKSSFLSRDFVVEGNDLTYNKPLPGFNFIKVGMEPYINYIKTKVENFQYYKLTSVKPEDLYGLSSISVTKDKDLEYIVKTLSSLLVSITVTVDTLEAVNGHFGQFTNELKVLAYNVENDQYTNLADLGVDDKLKDFIKFKLAMEASYININMTINYITSVLSVLDICLELSE